MYRVVTPHSINNLLEAKTPDELWQEATPLLKSLGDYQYSFVHCPLIPPPSLFTTHDKKFAEEATDLIKEHCEEIKDVFEEVSYAPYIWGANVLPPEQVQSELGKAFYKLYEGAGFTANVCMPLWSPLPRHQSILTVSTNLDAQKIQEFHENNYTILYTIAHTINSKLALMLSKEDRSRFRLSKRESDCLKWLSVGLRNNRIAQKLGISESTIEFHTINARRKLFAKTREEALSKALLFGLILPTISSHPTTPLPSSKNRTPL